MHGGTHGSTGRTSEDANERLHGNASRPQPVHKPKPLGPNRTPETHMPDTETRVRPSLRFRPKPTAQ